MKMRDLFKNFTNRPVALAIFVALFWLYGAAIITGGFEEIGPDPDDVMRFVQIRDWMDGQSWFDTNQYRLGLSAGTDMHWSRLPDIPIAILAWLFGFFTTDEKALHLASSIFPPLLGAGLLVIFARGADQLAGPKTKHVARWAVMGLGLVFVCLGIRFKPGAIDHHNLQTVLILMGYVGLLSLRSFKSGFFAGLALAIALAIGPEVYPFIALMGLFVALDWAWSGQTRYARSLGFGVGFAVGLVFLFILTVAPHEYAKAYCDQLSSVNVLAGMIGGGGLALSAFFLSQKSLLIRTIVLALIGIAVLVVVASIASQCLGNPLNDLPENMHLYWLDHIVEAKSLGVDEPNPLYVVPFYIGTACVASFVLIVRVFKKGLTSNRALMLICLMAAIGLTVYQIRFFLFTQLFAILPLALWISACYVDGKKRSQNIGYLLATALSLPFILTAPGLLLKSDVEPKESEATVDCVGSDVITALNNLPQSTILAPTSEGSIYLKLTEHHVLGANYHRNVAGLESTINIYAADRSEAESLVRADTIDYILICSEDNQGKLMKKGYPEGLGARLADGKNFAWLKPIGQPLSNGGVQIYKVQK